MSLVVLLVDRRKHEYYDRMTWNFVRQARHVEKLWSFTAQTRRCDFDIVQ